MRAPAPRWPFDRDTWAPREAARILSLLTSRFLDARAGPPRSDVERGGGGVPFSGRGRRVGHTAHAGAAADGPATRGVGERWGGEGKGAGFFFFFVAVRVSARGTWWDKDAVSCGDRWRWWGDELCVFGGIVGGLKVSSGRASKFTLWHRLSLLYILVGLFV